MLDKSRWLPSCVSPTDNLSSVLSAIDAGALQIALVVEGEKLVGLITDGDIRRFLLMSNSIKELSARDVMNTDFTYVDKTLPLAEVHRLMSELSIHQIPVLSEQKEILGLHVIDEGHLPMHEISPVVLMAGGLGTRLHPLTSSIPKPLLPVRGQPILEGLVKSLSRQGFKNIWISVGHMSQQIQGHFGDGSQFGAKVQYLIEEEPLGTAGCLSL